ncbi:Thiamine biosynthesis lipoprotein ApbE precursor [Rubripirellula lacrimiformis]|uniref:FAD:protein FMN transferase n=1 Tax=Rubripirellula lacrimiformis TaxID=1930273 RepID=A0A517N8Y7_9BACT|nr:FAD:protein FMN transferase [Rubripirellula lacrimiformis]QDT03596.1 Thiamine biosynthesis lipoprotein ApbE precursor [Rubripirellula lacrimiformis]
MPRFLALFFIAACLNQAASADQGETVSFGGSTMGTTYSVKIHVVADTPSLARMQDVQIGVDGVLRNVNDQMSTYLKSSEISRFNQSQTTEWFDVSPEFAGVVETAQRISEQTDGAFDVTVGPLVNAWNFGPDQRTGKVPDDAAIEALRQSTGYQNLAVRTDPPAIKKAIAALQIDLSAIAKGHGSDRVVEYLNTEGFPDVFVEIGGEVRTSGSKSGQWWKVGIQTPDAATDAWTVAHALSTGSGNDNAMATSGDYRNFFEADGIRYSHTIDPRTGRPIQHDLASVSVVAAKCVDADAWATALNVLGPVDGLEVAKRENISALLISRTADGFARAGSGAMAQYATDADPATSSTARPQSAAGSPWATMAISTIAFGTILFLMAIGVIFGRRAISGSCGGLANKTNPDGSTACGLCSNPADACKELRERMQSSESKQSTS